MSIFQSYSQQGCIFECSMEFAINTVGCLPWDFPVPLKWENAHLEICNSSNPATINHLLRFYEAMNNDTNLKACDCMPDCETIIYDTQVLKLNLTPNYVAYIYVTSIYRSPLSHWLRKHFA